MIIPLIVDSAQLQRDSARLGLAIDSMLDRCSAAQLDAAALMLPRSAGPAAACDRCGGHDGVEEDTDDGALLCGDCRWELAHPEQCPEVLPGGGRCGAPKSRHATRCLACEDRIYNEE